MATQEIQEKDFEDSPKGWAKRWSMEFAAARKEIEPWHKEANTVLERFLDKRTGSRNDGDTRWNFFTANVQTQRALLYGRTPQVEVSRRFSDANDDVARVASELLERLLNTDIERDSDSYSLALQYALDDRLVCGLGNVRVRYVADFEQGEETPAKTDKNGQQLAPAVPGVETKTREDVETDYVHWKDQLWSPARVFHEVRWWGFKSQMSREDGIKRFGDIFKLVPLNSKRSKDAGEVDQQRADPWSRADVWEIWSKEHKKVFWYVEGFGDILDTKDDPLQLEGFWPFPRPMFANLTTSGLLPRTDFALAQDLYNEIDMVSSRITRLERVIKVAGVYRKTAAPVERLVNEAGENELIPVDNWDVFAEKGGVKGNIDWLPLDQIVAALSTLRDYRTELINGLYQITGMSDIMRGQASDGGVTATEQGIKARFASVRLQALQDEFARFASDVQRLKAEIIAKQFEPETIIERSNAQYTFDGAQRGLLMQAVQLIKDKFSHYRIEVKPEAVSMTDYASLKSERVEFITALGGFFQQAIPLLQIVPGSQPFLLKVAQWLVAGQRGAGSIEGVFDQAITASEQQAAQQAANPQPPQQDPKVQAQQQKAMLDMQKQDQKTKGDLLRIQAETQANAQQQEDQAKWNIYEQVQKERIKQGGVGLPSPISATPPVGMP